MAFLYRVLASNVPDRELRVGGANVDCTAFVAASIIVHAATRVPCVLQMRRSCAVHSATYQRAIRLANEWCSTDRGNAHATATQALGGSLFVRRSSQRPGNEQVDARSHHGERFRAYDGETGRGDHPTDRWQDKSRKVRCGRVAQERRKIRHFAQRANRHDSVPIRTSTWKIDTSCTLCASAS